MKQKQRTIWLTGLPCSGKSSIAFVLGKKLFKKGHAVYVLDGENITIENALKTLIDAL